MTSKTQATSGLVFASRAAAADVAGDDSRCQYWFNKTEHHTHIQIFDPLSQTHPLHPMLFIPDSDMLFPYF